MFGDRKKRGESDGKKNEYVIKQQQTEMQGRGI